MEGPLCLNENFNAKNTFIVVSKVNKIIEVVRKENRYWNSSKFSVLKLFRLEVHVQYNSLINYGFNKRFTNKNI